MSRPLIALDADGVLLDFHAGYASAWKRAFGLAPRERDPQAYWPIDRWEVEHLSGKRLSHFGAQFDERFWSDLPALPGAVAASQRLADAGFNLVCVSALDERFADARLRNLRELGFPIARVVATGNAAGECSPKAGAIAAMKPVAFVDDYLPFLRGLPHSVHAALVLRAPNGSPNGGPELKLAHSVHTDLAAFAAHWLA
jgi:phosphoglycolate phosphatase-like HAD superfamily hydrolase